MLRVNNTRVAFKTAFGRYVSVDEASGEVYWGVGFLRVVVPPPVSSCHVSRRFRRSPRPWACASCGSPSLTPRLALKES